MSILQCYYDVDCAHRFAGLKGPTLFLDIDQIVIGDLDRFFDYCPASSASSTTGSSGTSGSSARRR